MIESRGEHRTVHLNIRQAINGAMEGEFAATYTEELLDEANKLSDRSTALSAEAITSWQREGKSAKGLALACEARGLAIARAVIGR